MAGLGKQFLLKLVAAWEELGKQSELMGDKVGVMEMEEAGDAIYPTKSKAQPQSLTAAQVKQEKVLLSCNTCGEAFRAAADLKKHEENHKMEDERKRKYFEKKKLEDLERKKIEEIEREKREAETERKKELRKKRDELKAAADEADRKREEGELVRRKREEAERRKKEEETRIRKKTEEEEKIRQGEEKRKREEEREGEKRKVMAIFSGGKVNQDELQERKRKAEEREALVERIKLARMMSSAKEDKKEEVEPQTPIVFSCTKCGKGFKKNIELKMHMRRDHNPSKAALALEYLAESEATVKGKQPEQAIQKMTEETPKENMTLTEPGKQKPMPLTKNEDEKEPLTVAMIVATSPYFGQYSGLAKPLKDRNELKYFSGQIKAGKVGDPRYLMEEEVEILLNMHHVAFFISRCCCCLIIFPLQIMPAGWKYRELGRIGSERRDKEFLSREGYVFRSASLFSLLVNVLYCYCFVCQGRDMSSGFSCLKH